MNLRDRQQTFRGFGDGLSRAFELAAVPALFAVVGHMLDRRLGTIPLFTVVLIIFAVVGMFVRIWFAYDREMNEHERRLIRERPRRP